MTDPTTPDVDTYRPYRGQNWSSFSVHLVFGTLCVCAVLGKLKLFAVCFPVVKTWKYSADSFQQHPSLPRVSPPFRPLAGFKRPPCK